jgi:hypothetical protein
LTAPSISSRSVLFIPEEQMLLNRLMKPAIICEARLGTDRHQEEEKTARLNLAFVARRLAIRRMRFTSSS